METTVPCLPRQFDSLKQPTKMCTTQTDVSSEFDSEVQVLGDVLEEALFELQEFCETLMGETIAVEELFGTTKQGLKEKFIGNYEKLFLIVDKGNIEMLQSLAEAALLNHADLAQDFFVELQQDEKQCATFFDLLEEVALAAAEVDGTQ